MKAASQCGGDSSEVRSLVPEFLLNRQNNSCPTIEELDNSGGWNGACVIDSGRDRLLPEYTTKLNENSPDNCIKECQDQGYSYAGVQFTNQCWCGNGDIPQEKVVPKSDCDSACPGDSSKMCGGFDRMNVYTAVESDPNTCILRSMGYLHTYGGVKHGKVKRDIAKLNPDVVDKYSGGILTDDDPSGYKQCIDNSYIKQQIPDLLNSCRDTYPGNRRYKKQIKRYMNRYAAITCLQKLSSACSEVWRDQINALAYPSGTEPVYEPITGTGYGYEPITGAGYGEGSEYEPIAA